MRATKQIYLSFYRLQKIPNYISSVFLKMKHHKKYQKKTDCLKKQRTPGIHVYIAPLRISTVKFWLNSPKINLFNKCTKGLIKAGVLWSKYLLILLLQLYLLLSSSQHFKHFISCVQSTSFQSEESCSNPAFFSFFSLIYVGRALLSI